MPSIALVILTGIVGASLARSQGLKTLGRIRDSFQQGVVPGEELLNALLIAIAGIVLLTPGFLTDAAGCFCSFQQPGLYAENGLNVAWN